MSRALTGHPQDMVMPPPPALPPGPWIGSLSATNTAWAGPWGVSFTANLTPDKETGLGDWTEEQFIATMRTGKHQGKGRPVLPPMPFFDGRQPERSRDQGAVGLSAVAAAGEEPGAAADRSAGRRRSSDDPPGAGPVAAGALLWTGARPAACWAAGAARRGRRRARAAAPLRDRALCRRGDAGGRRRATGRSRRSIRCGATAPPSGAGCGCPTARPSTRATSITGTSRSARASGRSSSSTAARSRRGCCGRPRADRWEFASYAWNEEQTRRDAGAGRGRRRRRRGGARQVAQHPVARRVPRLPRLGPHRDARLHRAAAVDRSRPAGAARRAADAEMVTLRTLVESRRLRPARPELARPRRRASPPRPP